MHGAVSINSVFQYVLLLLAVGCTFTICPCFALIEKENLLCTLYTFVPFTTNYDTSTVNAVSAEKNGNSSKNNLGFSHMDAALLAMYQFNNRDSSVVPELEDLTQNCPIQFDLNESRFFDSGHVGHLAADTMLQQLVQKGGRPPCAIAGPYHDQPAIDLSLFANVAQIPHVVHRAFAPGLLDSDDGNDVQFTSLIYPDSRAMARFHVAALQVIGRSDYYVILYPNTELGLSRRESLVMAFQETAGSITTWDTINYQHPGKNVANESEWDSLREALVRVKDRGLRTIIVAVETAEEELPRIASMADTLEMNNGEYFWSWLGTTTQYEHSSLDVAKQPMVSKLLEGSLFVEPLDPSLLLRSAILNQSVAFEGIVNKANPIKPGQPGFSYASPGYFSDPTYMELGQYAIFDAVMSIGIGACQAYNNNDKVDGNTFIISGASHAVGIRTATFTGGSGVVRFQMSGKTPGARQEQDISFYLVNILSGGSLQYTHYYNASDESWTQLLEFTFAADGTPPLLRNPPKMNYLNDGLRIFGLFMLSTVWLCCMVTCVWVWINRTHVVLMAAQPIFLYLLCLGSALFVSGILCLSFDESQGWNKQQLSNACSAAPWVIVFGHVIVYAALFSKLFRVNRVLQFKRRKVPIHAVMWPARGFVTAAILVMAVWTSFGCLQWERIEINSVTGESIGKCESPYIYKFVPILAVVAIVPIILTGLMAWKTRDIDDAYSESKWIFILIVLHLELCLFGAPVLNILRGLSTNGRYVGYVIMLWAYATSTLILIMLPKYLAVRRGAQGVDDRTQSDAGKRGSRANVRVSGTEITSSQLLKLSTSSRDKRVGSMEKKGKPPNNDGTDGAGPVEGFQNENLEI